MQPAYRMFRDLPDRIHICPSTKPLKVSRYEQLDASNPIRAQEQWDIYLAYVLA